MIEIEKMRQWAPGLAPLFQEWQQLLLQGKVPAWEFVAHYLLLFVFLNRPTEKWPQYKLLSSGQSESSVCFSKTVNAHLMGLVSEVQLAAWERCRHWVYSDMKSLRGVPEKVLQSLRGWRDGSYELQLMFEIPSAQELLRIQQGGRRCVSVLVKKTEIEGPVETGRDVWSFCLHDLLHASHFFGEPKYFQAQRFLSAFFLQAWEHSPLGQWLEKDPEFSREFIYVAADMNAHPVYILYSFYAKVLAFYKRQRGVSESEVLAPEAELLWRRFWSDWLAQLVLAPSMREALQLCTEPFASKELIHQVEAGLLAGAEAHFAV
jgi:hypothetical protein